MQLRRHNISTILLFAILAICLYLVQRIATFEISTIPLQYAAYREERYFEYILSFSALAVVSFWYFYIQYRSKAFKPHYPLMIFLGVLGIISIVMICVFPSRLVIDVPVYSFTTIEDGTRVIEFDYYKYGCIFDISIEQRIFYILITITVLYSLYLLLWVLPRKIRYLRQLNVVMYLLITFAVVVTVFSYITEFRKYAAFFEVLASQESPMMFEMIESFVSNRNSFGVVLMFAVFSCLYLHHQNDKWWFLVLPFAFDLQILLIGSKTNMLICSIAIMIYFIAWLILRFKKHLLSSLIITGIITLFVLAIGTLAVIHAVNNSFMGEAFNSAEKLFKYYVLRVFLYSENYSGRIVDYDIAQILLNSNGVYWIFGMGYGLFNFLFLGMENISSVSGLYYWDRNMITQTYSDNIVASDSPHSTFYQLVGTGGIITLVVYFILIAYLIFAMVRIFRKHKKTVILCATLLIASILHSLTESPSLFFLSPVYIDSLLLTIFVAVPVLSTYYYEKHPSENREFLANYEQKDAKLANFDKSCLISKSIYFFLTPVVVLMVGVIPFVWPLGSKYLALTIVVCAIAGAYVLLPIAFQLIFDRKTKFVIFLRDVLAPYYVEALLFICSIRLYCLFFGGCTMTMANIFMFVVLLGHIALFSRSKYYFKKAGIITLLLDKACNICHKYQEKYIEISDEKDSLTLQEKFFSLITPRRFKNHETTNNR